MAKRTTVDLDFQNSTRPINVPDPVAPTDGANKQYVDSAVEGLSWKESARVAATTDTNLAAPGANIDGVTLSVDDRVLLTGQTSNAENGIYIFNGASTPMVRSPDASTFDELEQAVVSVEEGSSADSAFRQTEINGSLDVDPVTFVSFATQAPNASETTSGRVEIATQAETDAGSDDARVLTPLKLAQWSGRKLKATGNLGDGSATQFNLDHNFGTRDVTVEVYRNTAPYDSVIADIERPTENRATIRFATAPASNAYRVVLTA